MAYLGNARQNNFIISVSNDGTTFTQKHSGTSSGTTTSPEKYSLPSGTECRYVRVTVNGNALYHKWQNTAGNTPSWSLFQSLGGNINGGPVVARNSDGRLEVFVTS